VFAKANKILGNKWLWVAIALIVVYLILSKGFSALTGLFSSKPKDKDFLNSDVGDSDLDNVHTSGALTNDQVVEIAQGINHAFGYLNDDETLIYSLLKQISNSGDYYRVAQYYKNAYNLDLKTHLYQELSADEFAIVEGILNDIK